MRQRFVSAQRPVTTTHGRQTGKSKEMSSDNKDDKESPEDDGVHPKGTRKRHFSGYWNFENTKPWVKMFENRMSAQAIAGEVGADPVTVSNWLKEHGTQTHQGFHRIERKPPKISPELAKLLAKGIEEVQRSLDERTWGILATPDGLAQLTKYQEFVQLDLKVGVVEAAKAIGVQRDSIRKWTLGIDQPYLVRVADAEIQANLMPGHKLLPMHLSAGGNIQSGWIQVPTTIRTQYDIDGVLRQIQPLERTYERAQAFGIPREHVE